MKKRLLEIAFCLAIGIFFLFSIGAYRLPIERDIGNRVQQALIQKDPAQRLAFTVDGRDVTLAGNVEDRRDKSQVAEAVGEVWGVRKVDNLIEVSETQVASAPKTEVNSAKATRAEDSTQKPLSDTEKRETVNTQTVDPCWGEFAEVISRGEVVFVEKNSELSKASRSFLNEFVETARKCREPWITILGRTENTDYRQKNLALNQERSRAVKKYLINRGLKEVRIFTKVYAPLDPNAVGAPEEKGRLEFIIEENI